jgi:hypothetical protein
VVVAEDLRSAQRALEKIRLDRRFLSLPMRRGRGNDQLQIRLASSG